MPNISKSPPAPEGMRYCNKCAGFSPIDKFYAKHSSFECKMHHIERRGEYKLKCKLDIPRQTVVNILNVFRMDGTRVFHRNKIGFTQKDIQKLFETRGVVVSDDWRLVPIDPDGAWCVENIYIVSKRVRRALMTIISSDCTDKRNKYVKNFMALT
jgi:hypothetical protein